MWEWRQHPYRFLVCVTFAWCGVLEIPKDLPVAALELATLVYLLLMPDAS